MRLAVVSPFVDRRHGTERALAELLERLAGKYGCDIHLFTQRVEGLALSSPGSAEPATAGAIFWHKVPRLPGPHILQFLAWFYLNRIWRFAFSTVRGVSFDVVFSPGINCSDARVILVHALFHRLKQLSEGARASSAERYGFLRHLHRRAYYALMTCLERRFYTNPRVSLAAVSQRTATLLAEYFQRRDVRVVPNGVDTARFSPSARLALRAAARLRRNLRQQGFVLLLIGNDWRMKGLETVLKAMAALRDLSIHILIAGEDSPGSFRECAKQLRILDRCHFEQPRQDVLDFYAAADLYVSPSREDSFGLPVLEAMACGLPVITSACAGVADLIQSGVNGFVLRDPRDQGELVCLLDELFRDPERRQRIGEAAATNALEWNWDRNAAAIFQLLESAAPHK